ncbi:hypothetical protein R3P38DRAFT_2758552 [Favolaschia claudopus]|uniref:Uncharacterized protein n=1 Tax=Favolaschia claudopus TaxID=2862362 RepID=A0AAW0EFD7_9AGAR
MATPLAIQTQIHSRYEVFDSSGRLPFSIVFGLCRRSSVDTDPRPLVLDIAGSALDVPFALANGLLMIHERDPSDIRRFIDVDLSRLEDVPAHDAHYLSLPSPINRTRHWRESFVEYLFPIEADSPLASILKPGKRYTVKLASEDLGVRWWAYGDRPEVVDGDGGVVRTQSENAKLVNSKSTAGNATFTCVSALPWPPRVKMGMRLVTPSNGQVLLDVSTTNIGDRTVLVQTRDRQSFLIPWGSSQPVSDTFDDSLSRIIDGDSPKPPTSSLRIVDVASGAVVRGNKRPVCSLNNSPAPRPPKMDWLVPLHPAEPKVMQVEIQHLVNGLADGLYRLEMEARGCWWYDAEVEADGDSDGRVHPALYKTTIPPLILETADILEVQVRNGRVFEPDP